MHAVKLTHVFELSNPRVGESEEDEWQTPKSGSVGGEGGHGGRRHSESKQERSYYKRTPKNKNKGATRTYKAQAKPSNKGSISGGARTSSPSQGSQSGSGQALARVTRSTMPQDTQLLTSY